MSKGRKILLSSGLFVASFLSGSIYYVILVYLADYILIAIFSIVMIFAGMALLMIEFKDNVIRDSWKRSLGLMLTTNPILCYVLYLILDPTSYTAF